MLQIISGKFFKTDDRYRFDAFGILYSNVACWRVITTPVATLHPVDPHGSVTQYVVTYINQIEKEEGRLVRTGDAEIVNQFRLLLMLGLRGFFATDRPQVEHVCRTRPASANDAVPSLKLDRFCDARIHAEPDDIARCETLIRDVLLLRRKTYVAVMSYVENFVHAIEAADTNVALAYSMLMYGIEALSQQFGTFEPTWEDYEPKVRTRVDDLLSHDPKLHEAVRGALLLSTPVRIQQRAAAFVEEHLPDEFFEAEHLKRRKLPLRRSFVRRSIRNAYRLRSKFVHELERGKDLHAALGEFDTLTRDHEPILTFRGLVRVAEEVFRHFVQTQEKVETEEIDWRSELPNVITMEMAPQYWIWRADTFKPNRAHDRLSAFLGQVEEARTAGGAVTDLRQVLVKAEEYIANGKGTVADRRAMACLYVLYHRLVGRKPELGELTVNENVWARCDDLLSPCSIESFVADVVMSYALDGSRKECAETVSAYLSDKFAKGRVKLPAQTEAALLATVGNMFLDDPPELETAREWFRRARLELVGHPEKQEHMRTRASAGTHVDVMRILGPWRAEEPVATTQDRSAEEGTRQTTYDPRADQTGTDDDS